MTRYIERVDFHRFLRQIKILLTVGLGGMVSVSGLMWLTVSLGLSSPALTLLLWVGQLAIAVVMAGTAIWSISDKLREARGGEEGDRS